MEQNCNQIPEQITVEFYSKKISTMKFKLIKNDD